MPEEKPNLENITVAEERDREFTRAFNIISIGGLIAGVLSVGTGTTMDMRSTEGMGYGFLMMVGLLNVVIRGRRYLRGRLEPVNPYANLEDGHNIYSE